MGRRRATSGTSAFAFGILVLLGPVAAQTVPVPTEAPVERPEPEAARPDAPGEGVPPDPAGVPVPEARPGDAAVPGAETPAAAPSAPVETAPSSATSPAPSPATDRPQPAYVSPEKARTEPEPGAPDVPPMAVTPAETVEAAAAVEDAVLCESELKARGARFTVGETVAEGDCGVLRPVSVTELSNGTRIAPGTVMLCRTALALDVWVSEGVAPAAAKEFDGAKVEALAQASTYVCRARASEARISEHSRGSAIDIAGFELSDKTSVPIAATEPGTPADRFAAAVRRAACGPFRTVLGPGTDSDHGTHLHLDIAARNGNATYCR